MKIVLICLALFVAFIGAAVIYSTVKGYTTWFWRDPYAQIFVNGQSVPGYVHQSGQVLFITRRDTPRPHSYQVIWRDQLGSIPLDCSQWVSPHLSVFALGDVNPPCLSTIGDQPPDAAAEAPASPLQHNANSFEFRTHDGKLIRVLL